MDLMKAIRARRSARKFKSTPVPDHMIQEMLEAARRAPSGGNSQNYCFGVVRDPLLRARLAEAAGGQLWVAQAPVVFACCADVSWDIAAQPAEDFGLRVNLCRFGTDFIRYLSAYPGRTACMTLFENASPLIPAEHIFLTAVSLGLGACFIGHLEVDRASRILNLPAHMRCLFLLPVGYGGRDTAGKACKGDW